MGPNYFCKHFSCIEWLSVCSSPVNELCAYSVWTMDFGTGGEYVVETPVICIWFLLRSYVSRVVGCFRETIWPTDIASENSNSKYVYSWTCPGHQTGSAIFEINSMVLKLWSWPPCDFYRAALNAGRSNREKGVRLYVLLSVCLSVRQTCELWQNGRKICLDFYTIRKII